MKLNRLTGAAGASAAARAAAGRGLIDILYAPATPEARASDRRDAANHAITAN
jgi:hypothetical protein